MMFPVWRVGEPTWRLIATVLAIGATFTLIAVLWRYL